MEKINSNHFPDGKWGRIFMFTKFQIVLLSCSMGTLAASPSYSQQKKIDVSYNKVSLISVLNDLEARTDYRFLYHDQVIPASVAVTFVKTNTDIVEILDEVLPKNGLDYSIRDEVVVISPAGKPTARQQQPEQKQLRGTVTEDDGKPLIGVTVMVKGTTRGTTTDASGAYQLNVNPNDVLIFSYLGKKTQEVAYTGQMQLNVTLEDDMAQIEQVVITGIFTRKAESFTGSVSSFTGAQLQAIGGQNALQNLAILDPAVSIIPDNLYGSDPNRIPDVDIRGKTTVVDPRNQYTSDPNQPLYILDGFEVAAKEVVNLNLNRIKSLTVLKDAASTAIYGAKAANGVIVIETVRPLPGRITLEYGGTYNIDVADLSVYNMMNAEEKLQLEVVSGAYNPTDSFSENAYRNLYNNHLENILSGVDTYWLKEPVRVGFTNKHNINIEGGDKTITYGVGLSMGNTQGVMKKSGNNTVGFNLDLSCRVSKFSFQNKLTLNHFNEWNPPVQFSTYVTTNPYYARPEGMQPRFLEEFPYISQTGAISSYRASNPLYNETLKYIDAGKSLTVRNNFYAEWNPLEGVKVTGRLSIEMNRNKTEFFKSPFHTDFYDTVVTERGKYDKKTSDRDVYSGDITASYSKLLSDRHFVIVNASAKLDSQKNIADAYTAVGFSDDIIPFPSFASQYEVNGTPSYTQTESRSAYFILNSGYTYDRRFAFDFNLRRDGTTNFGRNNPYTTSWSAGAAWNIHHEHFAEGLFENLKLRLTIGSPGNSNVTYATETTYKYYSKSNLFGSGIYINQYGSYNLGWEKVLDMNAGIDFTSNKRRIIFTFDIFRKIADPLIVRLDIPASTARENMQTNMGRNTINGFNFSVRYNIINRPQENIMWSIGVSGAHKTSKFSKMGDLSMLNDELRKNSSGRRYVNGGGQYDIWAVRSTGIDPATGDELFIAQDGSYTTVWNKADEVKIGVGEPTLSGNISTIARYRNWNFGFFLGYSFGQDELNNSLRTSVEGITRSTMLSRNQDKRALYDRWQKVGDVSKFKRVTAFSGEDTPPRMSDRWMQTENWLGGQSISLGYTFDNEWLRKSGISRLEIKATCNNIFDITSVRIERGIYYPFARTMGLQLSLSF